MAQGFFVTGTDTGVGKTLVSASLLHAFAARGYSTVGMKPVASGCEPEGTGMKCEDVEALKAQATVAAADDLINPYALRPPIAPHIAAEQRRVHIDKARILSAYQSLSALADMTVVEGVGGFRVPLGADWDTADLAVLLGLPVILVVGMRLGCISHALLTAESVLTRGLPLAGWVANRIDPDMEVFEANLAALEDRVPAPLLGVVDYMAVPDVTVSSAALSTDILLKRDK